MQAAVVRAMVAGLAHRGPDAAGIVVTACGALGMCHLRVRSNEADRVPLSIGSVCVAYNGEVYSVGTGHEPIVPVDPREEVTALLDADVRVVDGMYALASLGDSHVTLARDQFAIKPLYVHEQAGSVGFASELPVLLAAASPLAIDRSALLETLSFGRTLDGRTVYEGIRELEAGRRTTYWSSGLIEVEPAVTGTCGRADDSDLRGIIRETLQQTLLSKRRLGLALSGGLDSSILAYELRELGIRHLRTVSVLVESRRDGLESLDGLGLGHDAVTATWRHSVIRVVGDEFFAGIERTVELLGEPTRLSSVPLYLALAAKAAERGVVVLITGEGADELFAGYESYCSVAFAADPVAAALAFYLPPARCEYLTLLFGRGAVLALRQRLRDRVVAAAEQLQHLSTMRLLLSLERDLSLRPLLRRADHALMRYSVEGRVPYLHGGVPLCAAGLSDRQLGCSGRGKEALRTAYRGVLPDHVVEGPKVAFRAPVSSLLRGRLGQIAERRVRAAAWPAQSTAPRRAGSGPSRTPTRRRCDRCRSARTCRSRAPG